MTPDAPSPAATETDARGAAERVRRFLDERSRPTTFAPQGFLPVNFLAEITRTGDRLLASDLRALLDALDAAAERVRVVEGERDAAVAKLALPCGSCHPCTEWAAETWKREWEAGNRRLPHVFEWDELRTRAESAEAARAEMVALLTRVLDERRIRHDHGYPMEVGPHHCDGCDLIADIRALLAGGEGA